MRFTPNGRTVVSTGEDGDVVLWDVRQATTAGETLSGHAGAVGSAEITRDGRTLYTSSSGGTVFIWHLVGARASAGRSEPARATSSARTWR